VPSEEDRVLADLHWLIQDGYVVEFSNGRLWALADKPPQPPAQLRLWRRLEGRGSNADRGRRPIPTEPAAEPTSSPEAPAPAAAESAG
jgi:hypothetical protein